MKINKRIRLCTLLAIGLLITVVTPSMSVASDIGQTKSEKALDYISQKNGVVKERLMVVNEGYTNYVLTNQKIWDAKIIDRNSTDVYSVTLDENGNVIDPNIVKAKESAEYIRKYGKLEIDLYEKLQKTHPDERIKVVIWLTPVDTKTQPKPDNREVDEKTHGEFVSNSKWAIREKEKPIVDMLEARGLKVIYTSDYAPLIFTELTRHTIEELEKRSDVDEVYLSREYKELLNTIAPTEKASSAWNVGITGSGIKVAVVEKYRINFSNPYLADGTYYKPGLITQHPTWVAGIIASTHPIYKGISYGVPALLSANAGSYNDFDLIAATEWALNNGANILSNSWGNETNLRLSAMDRYLDHIVWNHHKTVVVAAGNEGGTNGNVQSPGLAYNVITVGAFDDKGNSLLSDDTKALYSSYKDPISRDREKPEVAAVGSGFSNSDGSPIGSGIYTTTMAPHKEPVTDIAPFVGTSFAAPSVSGEVALLMHAKNWLKSWPETVKAVIMSSAAHNIEGNGALSEYDGAGGIDISEAIQTVSNDWMRGETVYSSSFPKDYTFTVSAGQKVRVVIVWDSHPNSNHPPTIDPLQSDLDMYIRDPNGNTIAFSTSYDNSYEIVEFVSQVTGTYTARIHKYRFEGSYEYLGFAYSIV